MITLKDYVSSFGFTLAELTEKEVEQVTEELAKVNRGEAVLDGVLASKKTYK